MSNGLNGWAKWLVGVLFTILFTAFTTLTSHVIANEEKRVKDAIEIRREAAAIQRELNVCVKEQMLTNQQILIALAEIKSELKGYK